MDKITQEMKYRYSLVNYALKYGVSKASRRYNRARSYIYYWLKRFDGAIGSLATKSRSLITIPINIPGRDCLIIRYRRRNAELGLLSFGSERGSGIHPSLRQFISRGTKGRLERSRKPRQKGLLPNLMRRCCIPASGYKLTSNMFPESIQDKTWESIINIRPLMNTVT